MDSKQQNIQTNTFSGGMNSDVADHLLNSDQYRYARNLRFVHGSDGDTGQLQCINGDKEIFQGLGYIKNTYQIDKYGILFVIDKDGKLRVYRFEIPQESSKQVDVDTLKIIFGPCSDYINATTAEEAQHQIMLNSTKKFSIAGRKEGDDNIKLYVADGVHTIMIIDVLPELSSNPTPTSINQITSNNTCVLYPPKIEQITSGNLKAGANQYSYQLYSRYKQSTQVSPTTKLIPIVYKNNDYDYTGVDSGKSSNIGIKLSFDIKKDIYDTIRIFRIHYNKVGDQPEVSIIYDGIFRENFTYTDDNNESLQKLTIQEYNSISGIHIIPRVIESKDDYLFAAQIKESSEKTSKFDEINTVALRFSTVGEPYASNYNDKDNNLLYGKTIEQLKADNWKLFDDVTSKCDCFNNVNDTTQYINTINDGFMWEHSATGYKKYAFQFTAADNSGNIYYGGTGKHIDWKFVVTQFSGDCNKVENKTDLSFDDANSKLSNKGIPVDKKRVFISNSENIPLKNIQRYNYNILKKYYIDKFGSFVDAGYISNKDIYKGSTYNDPIIASNLKSLRRGELYRFGVIFTDSLGNKSRVKWITDIRVPDLQVAGFHTFEYGGVNTELGINSLGVEFILHDLDKYDIAQYEIVRCNRTSNDISVVSQGVISRPVKKIFKDYTNHPNQPYTPNFVITTNKFITSSSDDNILTKVNANEGKRVTSSNLQNCELYQFISPEFSYNQSSFADILNGYNTSIRTIKYLFPQASFDKSSTVLNVNDNDKKLLYIQHGGATQEFYNVENDKFKDNALLYNMFYGYNILNENYNLNVSSSYKYNNDKILELIQNSIKTSKRVFKYYNQSHAVTVVPHEKGYCDNVSAKDENGKINVFGSKVRKVSNKCGISSYKFVKGLKWNDFASTDSKGNTIVSYIDKINTVGQYQFCNWVSGNLFGEDIKELKTVCEVDGLKVEYYDVGVIGPGSSSLLMQIDNKWNNINTGQEDCEVFQLSDTVGSKYIQSVLSDNLGNPKPGVRNVQYDNSMRPGWNENYVKPSPKWIELGGYDEDLSKDYIYGFSMLGTYLCNITKDIIPYGGFQKSDIDDSLYYSYSDIYRYNKNQENRVDVFNGDTYICPFEYVSTHKFYHNDLKAPLTTAIVNYIPVETSINLFYTNGFEFAQNKDNANITWLQEEPAKISDYITQDKPQHIYNTAYSSDYKASIYSSKSSLLEKDVNNFNYRCRYSNKKENGELRDSWVTFMAANYIDVNPDNGKITNLETFRNNLIFFQESAFGIMSVNERTTLTDNDNNKLLLGSGGVLDRYDYISTENGMLDESFASTVTPNALYWIDFTNKQYCQYTGQANYQILSKVKNIQKIVESGLNSIDTGKNSMLERRMHAVTQNTKYNEVLFTLNKNTSLVFNEQTQQFYSETDQESNIDSINTFGRSFYCSGDYLYEYDSNEYDHLYKYKDMLGVVLNFQLKYVVNDNPQTVKVFDNVLFGGNEQFKNQIKESFHTQGQDSNILESDHVSNRYYDYRFAIPRANVNNALQKQYGNRMRGKTMICNIENKASDKKLAIQYITTKYRTLWS